MNILDGREGAQQGGVRRKLVFDGLAFDPFEFSTSRQKAQREHGSMIAKRTRKPFFERLKQGLENGIAFTGGELSLKTVEIPDEPPQVDAATLAAIRNERRCHKRCSPRF